MIFLWYVWFFILHIWFFLPDDHTNIYSRGASWLIQDFTPNPLEPVCCKKWPKSSSWPVTGLRNKGPLKDSMDFKLILNESKLFPWSSRISLVPFRTFRGPLFPKPVTGQELFLAVSYSKPALTSFLPFFACLSMWKLGDLNCCVFKLFVLISSSECFYTTENLLTMQNIIFNKQHLPCFFQ